MGFVENWFCGLFFEGGLRTVFWERIFQKWRTVRAHCKDFPLPAMIVYLWYCVPSNTKISGLDSLWR